MDRGRLEKLARRNLGLFTRAQAGDCGYSRFQVRHRVMSGDWQVVMGKVLAPAGLKITAVLRDRAAQLSIPGSVLAGASAARVLGIPVPDDRIFLYVGAHGRARLPGVKAIHHTLDKHEVIFNEGLPLAVPACALVESLLWLPDQKAISLLDRTLQRGNWTFPEFSRRVDLRRGSPGYPRLVRLRDHLAGGERSEAERRMTALLHDAGISGFRTNLPVADARGVIGLGDLVFEQERLIVEIDGWAYHTTPQRYEADRERQNRLIAAGWRVLRFTWQHITQRPDYVIAAIRAELARPRSSDTSPSVAARSVG